MATLFEDRKEWEEDKVLSLIEAYKASPTLWNHNSVEYKNRKLKMRTLQALGDQFNTTAEEVRRKIHNLRCQYNAELRKIKRKSVEHNIAENLIYSEWKYFDQLNFLAEVYIVRPSKRSNDTATTPNQMPIVTKLEIESSETDDDYEEPTPSKTPRLNETDRTFISNDYNVIKPSDEDHRIFGEYVASELRNLSDRNAKKLKMMIRKAILEVTEDEYSVEANVKCEIKY